MVVQFTHNGKLYFLADKKPRKQPSITPYRSRAWEFKDLNRCKVLRDDILEYFSKAVVSS